MANRKGKKNPNPDFSGNEKHVLPLNISHAQRRNLDTALVIYRIKNTSTTLQDLVIEALEAYYGPQDVRSSAR